ncbi:MAG: hypothetical protein ABJA82_14025 [Myxococcales bacterium]
MLGKYATTPELQQTARQTVAKLLDIAGAGRAQGHYHRRTDTPDQVAYDRLARVVLGIDLTVRALTR